MSQTKFTVQQTPPPPQLRPELALRQVEILREIGASERTIALAEAVAKTATDKR